MDHKIYKCRGYGKCIISFENISKNDYTQFDVHKILLRLDYMPLYYISLNLFAKCLYFQSIFILYDGSSKIENFDLATKNKS